jgi:hypothetical protein
MLLDKNMLKTHSNYLPEQHTLFLETEIPFPTTCAGRSSLGFCNEIALF